MTSCNNSKKPPSLLYYYKFLGGEDVSKDGYLEGKLLLAMPGMGDSRFERNVIYMCSHNEEGAMGIVINREISHLNFPQLLEQLDIDYSPPVVDIPIHAGGPVDTGRGFVIHSADFVQDSTLIVSETIALTATVDILKALAVGQGPKSHLLALGYAGWGAGQLDQELKGNGWISTSSDDEVIFHTDIEDKWPRAMARMGVDVSMLSASSGHA